MDGKGGEFSFTPTDEQVGTHIFDFVVSDGNTEVRASTTIAVTGGGGSGTAPQFKRPLSQGTVLDVVESSCAEFDIEVEDPDSDSILLTQVAERLKAQARSLGLDGAGRRYLTLLAEDYGGGPVGVETISAALSEVRDAIEEVIEPFLLQSGLIQRTPRGRMLGQKGWKHLGLSAPKAPSQSDLFDEGTP